MPGANQSNVIFAFLAVAFVIFITMRGEIGVYMGFLLSTPKTSNAASGTVDISALEKGVDNVNAAAAQGAAAGAAANKTNAQNLAFLGNAAMVFL